MTNIHVLIIEDNSTNIEVLTRLLSLAGATMTIVQNPMQLEEVLETIDPIDVAFVDLEMPKRDGYQVLEILREFGITAPIVAYTVHTSEIATAEERGFDSYLSKPVKATQFMDQLNRILSGEEVWEAQ